jgi:acetyl esterase/lipase
LAALGLTVALDPAAKRLLDMLAVIGVATDPATMTPQSLREGFRRLAAAVDVRNVPLGKVKDGKWPAPSGKLPYRAYYPQPSSLLRSAKASARPGLPALVFFHGGGCIFGDIDTHDGLCRTLAAEGGCAVISIGYRQAPEHKFPAAVEDAYAAIRWVVENPVSLGIDMRRIAVGGDSAGGGLAAVVCQMAAAQGGPRVALQVLFCPVMDMAAETASRTTFAEGYFLDRVTIDWMLRQYCPPGIDPRDPRLSPLRAAQLRGLPPAHIHTAEYDPLRDEGEAYAQRLRDAGVTVHYTCHAGMIHHFYAMAGAIPAARTALEAAGGALRQALATPDPPD